MLISAYKFLLCSKWWNQWCDYVNLESKLYEEDATAFSSVPEGREPESTGREADPVEERERLR